MRRGRGGWVVGFLLFRWGNGFYGVAGVGVLGWVILFLSMYLNGMCGYVYVILICLFIVFFVFFVFWGVFCEGGDGKICSNLCVSMCIMLYIIIIIVIVINNGRCTSILSILII